MNNWKLYIANRIHFDKQHRKKATPPAVRVAVAGVALGLAIMILSVAIVIGFKKEIRSKVVGFGAHIQITSFDNNMTSKSSRFNIPIVCVKYCQNAMTSQK